MVLPSYCEHPSATKRLADAVTAAQHVLKGREVLSKRILHRMLNVCIWRASEANGKQSLRYRSKGSLEPNGRSIHEHVRPRRTVVADLLKCPERCHEILEGAIACLVTPEEHERLEAVTRRDRALDGWERYKAAGVEVCDLKTQAWIVGS